MSIFTVLKANLRSKKSNFISVMFLMFLVTLVVTTAYSVSENSKNRAEQSLNQSQVGDLWCNFNENVLTEEMIEQAEACKEVEKIYRVPSVVISGKNRITVAGTGAKDSILFQIYDKENMPYPVYSENNLEILKEPEPLQQGEIYLPVSFQAVYSCKVGDLVEIEGETVKETFRIKAFIEDMTLGNPIFNGMKNAWISDSDYEMLRKAYEAGDQALSSADNLMIYQKKDGSLSEKEFKNEIDEQTGIISTSYMMITKNEFITYATMMTNLFSAVMVVFAILLFAGVLGIVGHSITSTIEMDYVNLGILKSQGYRKQELQAIYSLQYILAGAIGEVLGFLTAFPATYFASGLVVQLTGFLPEHEISVGFSLSVMLLMLCFVWVFTFIKTGKVGKISPMRAISGGRDSIYFSSRIKTSLGKGGLTFRMMLKQITTNAKQYMSSLVIVAMLVYFIMAVVSTLSCMDEENMLKDYYGVEFDVQIDYKESMSIKEEVENIIAKYAGIKEAYKCSEAYLVLEGDSISVTAPEDSESFTNVFKGREPRYENEIIITEVIARKYHLEIGDTVALTHGQESREFLITGFFQSVSFAGKTVDMLYSGLKRYEFSDDELNQYNYLVSDREQIGSLVEELEEQFGDKIGVTDIQGIRESLKTISDAFFAISLLVYGIAILFIWATAYMVCDKVFLKEKRDYGIYKSQGFTTGNLRLQFSLRFLAVSLAGSVLGALCNVLTSDALMGMALSCMGITHFETNYGFADYFGPISVLAATFFFFAYIISGRIKRVDTKSLIVE